MTDIPKEMKQATWVFYIRATDLNPGICITGTRLYIMHLINMFRVAGIHEYDAQLEICMKMVSVAWHEYADNKDWGKAFQECVPALDKLGFIAFDDRYSTIDITSFKGVKR